MSLRRPFDMRVRRAANWEAADRIMSRFAPFALMTLPLVWIAVVLAGFMPIYWALGVDWPRDAFEESGSSLLTLGPRPIATDQSSLHFVEATLGLGLVALLISFLPTMYQLFSRREVLVSQLDVRAGTPPTPVALFRRAERIGWIEELDGFWVDWERWFTEVEESHTSYLALSFFRSPHHGRSWITASGAVLDSAALGLRRSTCRLRGRPSCACAPVTWRSGGSPAPTASDSIPTRPPPIRSRSPATSSTSSSSSSPRSAFRSSPTTTRHGATRRLAGQLRHGAADAVRPADGPALAMVVRPGIDYRVRLMPTNIRRHS